MNRVWRVASALGVLLGLGSASRGLAAEEADEEERVIPSSVTAGKGRPPLDVVQSRAFYKGQRLELFWPSFAYILSNQFAHRYLAGTSVSAAYHISEIMFVEGTVQYYPTLVDSDYGRAPYTDLSSLTLTVAFNRDDNTYLPDILKEQFYGGISLGISPVYGKLNLVSTYVQNFDLSAMVGLGALQLFKARYLLQEVSEEGVPVLEGPYPVNNEAGEEEPFSSTRVVITPHVGIAMRFFLNHSLTLRADLRLHAYVDESYDRTTKELNDTRNVFRQSMVVNAGVSGFLPFQKTEGGRR